MNREEITREVKGEIYKLGYTSMMKPSHTREKGKVFKMFQIFSDDPMQAGDIHFFECIGEQYILIPDYSFINLYGNQRLIDFYMDLPRNENIEFDTFIRLIFYALYS